MTHYSVLIVGAGLAGLMAAKQFSGENVNYIILDKGRSVGGRMATKRLNGGRSDYGAQFFTARSDRMKNLVKQWEQEGIIHTWAKGFHQMKDIADLGSLTLHHDGYPRYAGKNGMNALTKQLANGLNIKLEHEVEKIEWTDKWSIFVRVGKNSELLTYTADQLMLTSPIPKSLALLSDGRLPLEEQLLEELKNTSYFPCLCAMIALDRPTQIPKPGGIQIKEGLISFLGDNAQKGISDTIVVTIHGNEHWSRKNYEQDDQYILEKLIEAARPLLGDGKVIEKQLKRWRYSKPELLHPNEFVATTIPGVIAFAGDIFKRGAVEGAILSGIEASKWMLKR
ncbi:NAD(P)/FAD-dependent oxidoreductase [Alkalihalobacillus sp. BA299]|uniref:NAD(P)/FAD-dependent oxidoreductase n=1 Tax=Alkalihalobacillus sp. BA299 TaxID=2815938 RepID=UPI001ADD4CC8|nr:FAD-dependent oxidoreductase [Alkalihalobacillus sp. BA299]